MNLIVARISKNKKMEETCMRRKVCAVVLGLAILALPTTALAAEYSDTQGHWAQASIERWSDAGVVNGVAPGVFNPDGNMSRAEAAQIFTNLLKLTGAADLSAYTDVDADAWYADAIAACVDAGVMNGVGDNQMNPTGTITREMFFVMFARALGIPEEETLEGTYADSGSISDWARGSVYALVNNGYVAGTNADSISPLNDINRASVIALLDQTIKEYVVENGTVQADEAGVVLVLADDVTITGSADVMISVAAQGAKLSLDGYTGSARVAVLADDVSVTGAPAGTEVLVADGVTGATVNGTAVTADSAYTVPESRPSSTGGGSSSGGNTPTPDPTPTPGDDDEEEQVPPTEETRPTITVGGKDYIWDDDKEEYIFVGADGKEEILNPGDITGGIEDQEESTVVVVDNKEYYYDAEEKEWFEVLEDDEEEYIPTDKVEEALNGGASNSQENVD